MRIKRIEIHGFKSFADKTDIDLGAGLTAVVGPNGSGKSNLAEAVKWVLGEQSARILRGQRMDDIIFSGTAKRKGVGYAEVSLVFDNAEKRLPLEYSEVVITRRAYRSGEGEYLINRKACRLRDITELFLDTGVGKDSYSFVGQGRIEEILNADPRQRRGIFEEAAGISRYKLRKRETETRLDEVQANLRRVSDIEAELQMQLAPLQEEAERASRYLDLQSTRDSWSKELLLYEMGLAERQVASIRTQIEKATDESLGRENQRSILEAERSEFTLRHSTLISDISRVEADLRMVEHSRGQLSERLTELES
ncbi:MAG TPA: AAA family ATPase, partial [Bacillota bacterium]|nr:AAA family ATPase [Bacillota bacterium]